MMSGHEDDRLFIGVDPQSMFPNSETPTEMDLDEILSFPPGGKGPDFTFNVALNGLPVPPPPELGGTDHFIELGLHWDVSNRTRTSADQMDMDQSPALTLDLNLYFDTQSSVFPDNEGPPNGATPDVGSLFTNEDQSDLLFNTRAAFGTNSLNGASPDSTGHVPSIQRNPSLVGNRARAISLSERMESSSFQMHPDRYYGKQMMGVHQAPSFISDNRRGLAHLLPGEVLNGPGSHSPDNEQRTNTYLDTPEYNAGYKSRHNVDKKDNASYRTSLLGLNNELLPFTTNTSFTPSMASLHLNQPSFVSAQQYIRPLMEQSSRASFDIYNRYGMTPESLSLGTPPVRTQRTFASYFPFMDKDRKQNSPEQTGIDGNFESQHPRALIRSIFKGSNQPLQPTNANPRDVMSEVSNVLEENIGGTGHEDESQQLPPAKAPKRAKKGIFDRFKTSKPSDALQDSIMFLSDGEADNLELSRAKTLQSTQSQSNISRQSSALNSGDASFGGSISEQISAGLENLKVLEPNYGALFKGVAKRRTLVTMKGRKKSHVQLKKEIKVEEAILDNLSPAISKQLGSDDARGDNSSLSPLLSQASSASRNPGNDDSESGSGTLASASKRILGSRLLKRKGSGPVKQEPPTADVEVDLQKLHLPVNTEIQLMPQKNRPRGRREDKEADLVDDAKIYICGYCSRRFKRQEHLKRHFRSLHTAERPFDCPICQKKFSRTDNLTQHLKVHKQSGDKIVKEEMDDSVKEEMYDGVPKDSEI